MGMTAARELFEAFRHDPPPVHFYCSCGLTFEAATETEAVRMQERHAAEMRDLDEHEGLPF